MSLRVWWPFLAVVLLNASVMWFLPPPNWWTPFIVTVNVFRFAMLAGMIYFSCKAQGCVNELGRLRDRQAALQEKMTQLRRQQNFWLN